MGVPGSGCWVLAGVGIHRRGHGAIIRPEGIEASPPVSSIDACALLYEHRAMNGREFVRHARRYARRHKLAFRFDTTSGKGSHGRLHLGGRLTTVPYGEIGPGLFASMLKDLDIDRKGF